MATRWGLYGAGKISHDFSVAMKTLPPGDHQVLWIASRSWERAKEFAKRPGIPKAYGSCVELASNPYIGELRAVSGCTGPGKNVLCENPFAMNSCRRRYAGCRRRKAVGEHKLVKAYFGFPQLHIPHSVEKELGGGALLDIGVPQSIQSVVMVMKFSRNRMAFCAFSIAARLPNDAVISGTEGSIKVLGPIQSTLCLHEPGLPLSFTNSTGLRDEADEVRLCLLLKVSPRMPLADSVLLTEIMDEIRKQVGVAFSQDSK
uniref:Dihydrodiol dehydrogenase, tandem duplicate 1 n=1 Tax=Cyclopterus lumpus TaxID=8103 RepID=A0A8C3AQR4_CYCLU